MLSAIKEEEETKLKYDKKIRVFEKYKIELTTNYNNISISNLPIDNYKLTHIG